MSPPRHLVIDARSVRARRTGVGNSVYRQLLGIDRLLAAGERGWRVTVIRFGPDLADPDFRSRWSIFRHLHLIDTPADPTSHPAGDWWQQVTLPALLRRLGADIVYSPAYVGPLSTGRVARAVMLHDDLVWSQAESYPWKFRLYIRTMARLSARSATTVLYPSEDARKRCNRRLGLRSRAAVVPHGLDVADFPPAPLEGRDPIVLCVASAERRKNQEVLVRALAGSQDLRLVLIGVSEHAAERIAELRRLDPAARIEFIPHADEKTISQHLRRAAVFALPSRGEGFGLPVLEAMASGTPMVLSDIPVLHEVAGDSALYRHPDDVKGWADALREAAGHDAATRDRVARGMDRLPQFTLEGAAERLLKVLDARATAGAAKS